MKRIIRFEAVGDFDLVTDVVVSGFGGAGASAALEARRAGSEVIVLERASGGGGSTMMSACEMYLGGGTRLQRDLGIEDSQDNYYRYFKACFGDNCDEARLQMLVDGAAEHFDWAESLGIPYRRSLFPDREVVALTGDSLQYTGNEKAWPFSTLAIPVPRGHLPADSGHEGGITLMNILMKRVEEAGADIRCDARVTHLIQDINGRIRGVAVRIDNRDLLIRARQGVVLCMGGFIMNQAMTRKYLPELDPIATRHGNPGDMGEGILMGVDAGANTINMHEAFVGIAHYPPARLTYGIFVNQQGQRFINEDVYLARLGHYAMQQQDGRIYMFIDNTHFDRPAYLNTEIIAVGESVAEVEQDAGLPAGSLQNTVRFYNEHAARGEDPLFHKAAEWLQPFTNPPYALVSYAVSEIKPPVFTLGGLEALPDGEVLTSGGEIIPGLFAAGRTVAGVPRTSKGYASGMSVADVTFFGRRAGQRAAREPRVAD